MLSFAFGTVAGLNAPAGVPYFVFTFAGMTAWNLYSTLVTRSSSSLVSNAAMIQKVFFPRLLLPLSSFLSTLVDLAVSLVVLGILLVIYSVWAGAALLTLPLWLLLFSMAGLGLGLTAGALSVRYRDVQYVLPVAISFLLFAEPHRLLGVVGTGQLAVVPRTRTHSQVCSRPCAGRLSAPRFRPRD